MAWIVIVVLVCVPFLILLVDLAGSLGRRATVGAPASRNGLPDVVRERRSRPDRRLHADPEPAAEPEVLELPVIETRPAPVLAAAAPLNARSSAPVAAAPAAAPRSLAECPDCAEPLGPGAQSCHTCGFDLVTWTPGR
jgi:hypothetical protein